MQREMKEGIKLAENSFTKDTGKLWNQALKEIKEAPQPKRHPNNESKHTAKCSQSKDRKENMRETKMIMQTEDRFVIKDGENSD